MMVERRSTKSDPPQAFPLAVAARSDSISSPSSPANQSLPRSGEHMIDSDRRQHWDSDQATVRGGARPGIIFRALRQPLQIDLSILRREKDILLVIPALGDMVRYADSDR